MGSLVPGVLSRCLPALGKESEAPVPNSAHAQMLREDPNLNSNLSESVKMARTTATYLGRGHLPWRGESEEKPVCVVGNVWDVHQLEGLKIADCFLLIVLRSSLSLPGSWIKCAVSPRQPL